MSFNCYLCCDQTIPCICTKNKNMKWQPEGWNVENKIPDHYDKYNNTIIVFNWENIKEVSQVCANISVFSGISLKFVTAIFKIKLKKDVL